MNRWLTAANGYFFGVPRVSGDEPEIGYLLNAMDRRVPRVSGDEPILILLF